MDQFTGDFSFIFYVEEILYVWIKSRGLE